MHRFSRIAALAAAANLAACGYHGTIPTQYSPASSQITATSASQTSAANLAQRYGWTPRYANPRAAIDRTALDTQAAAGMTIQVFSAKITSPLDHKTFTYVLAGTDPHGAKVSTAIPVVPIIARIHYADGTVLDPTKPACGDSVSIQQRVLSGPNFANVALTSNGINVGTTQLTDGLQRAEFWTLVKGSNYHVLLKPSAPVIVDVKAPAGSKTVAGVCAGKGHRIGEIDFNAYTNITAGLADAHAKANQLAFIVTYNQFETAGGCCILGFHSAFTTNPASGTHVFGTGSYNDPGIFQGAVEDVNTLTHELGEAFNDPFLSNNVPAWGHVGQVGGCQTNLEVGDPLSGTSFKIALNGFTYHPQELAFFDWFYRTPAEGTGGEFSFEGTFESAQGVCH